MYIQPVLFIYRNKPTTKGKAMFKKEREDMMIIPDATMAKLRKNSAQEETEDRHSRQTKEE